MDSVFKLGKELSHPQTEMKHVVSVDIILYDLLVISKKMKKSFLWESHMTFQTFNMRKILKQEFSMHIAASSFSCDK